MNDHDLKKLLKRHDPAGTTPPLDAEQAAAMRSAVLRGMEAGAAREGARPAARLALAGALSILLLVAGAVLSLQKRTEAPRSVPSREALVEPASRTMPATPRQVQMVTPGGTRIVWILNPDLTL